MINITIWLAFLGGLISFASPCVLPLVPAYIGYMSNRVTAQVVSQPVSTVYVVQNHRFQMALHGLAFVIGFTFIFVVFGLAITAGTRALALATYDLQRVVIPHVGGVLIILFGLHFLGVVGPFLRWLERNPILGRMGRTGFQVKRGLAWLNSIIYADTRPHLKVHRSFGLFGSSLMGVIFAAGWTPCIGPIYGTMLTMAASGNESLMRVGGLMTVYSLGLGLPFIATALALDRVEGLLGRLKRHLNALKIASGIVMICIGILIYTGMLQRISQLGSVSSALIMYKIEECTIQVFDGNLPINEIKNCVDKQR